MAPPNVELNSASPYRDEGAEFATRFNSPTLCVYVGPAKTAYYLHRQILLSKSPYFKSLLSFNGVETASGAVTLDSTVDADDAFQMFVEYIYLNNYHHTRYPLRLGRDEQCLLYARVYALAERLCMEDLKSLALEKMASELAEAYTHGARRPAWNSWSDPDKEPGERLKTETVVGLVEFTYENTPGLDTHGWNPVESASRAQMEDVLPQEASSDESEEEVVILEASELKRRDKMRVLVARYAASVFSDMRSNEDFMAITRTSREFSDDLMDSLLNGDRIEHDEWKRV